MVAVLWAGGKAGASQEACITGLVCPQVVRCALQQAPFLAVLSLAGTHTCTRFLLS